MNGKPYLEPYRGRSSRHECPACHDKQSLARYLDGDTGAVIHSSVGRCNHESGCGYHYTPKQFFEDNPERQDYGKVTARSNRMITIRHQQPGAPKEPGRIPKEYIIRAMGYNSNFVAFLCSIFDTGTLESPTIQRLMSNYYLGAAKDGSIIYWQIGTDKRVRTGKIMQYNPLTGKRIKDASGAIDWVHAKLKRRGELPDNFNLVQCLFGEHLLNRYPDRVVALVESEKSALIGAGCYPDYVWLATGGRSQLSADKLKPLRGRTVIMFPDVDGYTLWCEKAREIEAMGCKVVVSDLLERNASPADRESKIDLADWLIRQLKATVTTTRLPQGAIPTPSLTAEEKALHHLGCLNPNVYTLIDTLGLAGSAGNTLRIIN